MILKPLLFRFGSAFPKFLPISAVEQKPKESLFVIQAKEANSFLSQ